MGERELVDAADLCEQLGVPLAGGSAADGLREYVELLVGGYNYQSAVLERFVAGCEGLLGAGAPGADVQERLQRVYRRVAALAGGRRRGRGALAACAALGAALGALGAAAAAAWRRE